MTTLICGTNRPNNVTSIVVRAYAELLKSKGEPAQILELEHLPQDFIFRNDVIGEKNPVFSELVVKYIAKVERIVIISPEYNGGFPGVLKSFIDAVWPADMKGKRVALVGVASGRAGNLRGMDQLTNILHYLSVHVLPFKVPISSIDKYLNEARELTDENTLAVLNKQVDLFLNFE